MKRDLELVRKLLIEIEEDESGGPIQLTADENDNYTHEDVQYHLKLMSQAGLIDGRDISTKDSNDFLVRGMTWQGHDFLDAARNEKVWQTANETAVAQGTQLSSLPLEIAKELLISATKGLFGLS